MEYDAFDAILHTLFKKTQSDAWFKPSQDNVSSGICLRADTGQFRVFPYENRSLAPFETAVRLLNPLVAVKLRSAAVHAALATVEDDATAIYLDNDTRIQIVESMSHLPSAEREQCGAFIKDEHVLVVWSDDIDTIVDLCEDFEDKLMKLIWKNRHRSSSVLYPGSMTPTQSRTQSIVSPSASNLNLTMKEKKEMTDSVAEAALAEREKSTPKKKSWTFGWRVSKEDAVDPEKASKIAARRPIRLFAPVYGGLGAGLSIFFIASGLNVILQEWRLDGDFVRFALMATAPFLFCVSLFFSLQVITNLSFILGPVAQYHENSRYYSAVKPEPNMEVDRHLPHITIELPVYKESLEETIAPSVFSIKKAMQNYARQGGTSSIFIHDDGLQLISSEERNNRVTFYANHNIGWVARPPHSNEPDGFKRAGRFKKASNMNHGLALSLCMERHIAALESAGEEEVDIERDISLEEKALQLAIDEFYENSGKKWSTWANNARSLRVGEIILIVDADTLVPHDCFRDAARELFECPEVAIIQHESDVMQVAHNFFENGITHFTRRINKCISMAAANGEVAPFVGHNAFLRWQALQEAAFHDASGDLKIWAEDRVSEDFDMALRLQLKGYIIRWATYSKGDFKEGVSLTVDDELNRWQKYSYGCNELIFNPFIKWFTKGPVSSQLRTFLWSGAPVHYKLSMQAYMYSYYGIAAAALLSLINYALLGFEFEIDGFYMHSFEIWLACTVVFPGAGNLAYTLLEYRLGQRDLLPALVENCRWIPFFFFFFGGLSIHLSTALLAHLFSYNMTWGATKKEVERSNFWIEVPRIWRRFKLAFILCGIMVAGMVVLATPAVPREWQILGTDWAVILPLAIVVGCHILFPIVLNPWLMIFSY